MQIPLNLISQNPNQKRSISINDEELQELARSIQEHGLLQPIKVRPKDSGYELVYGHRRVRAMRMLGWDTCEAIIEEINEEDSIVQSIAENIQRQDLDILEEAQSYQILVDKGFTLKEIAGLLNKPQGRISNRLSILRLPQEVQQLVKQRKGQHTSTTELGGISPDSASRIASAISKPEEAIEIARIAIEGDLKTGDIRQLTAVLKEIDDPKKRNELIRNAWQYKTIEKSNSQHEENSTLSQVESYSLSDLYHRKLIWNLNRLEIAQYDHFTIGYSGRSIDQFIELLQCAQIEILIDIRYVPISRFKPEFSKSNLEKTIEQNNIHYIHAQNLGIPAEIRKSSNLESVFSWYSNNIDLNKEMLLLEQELAEKRLCFMCVEVDPQSCHRHLVFEHLEELGYNLIDL